jgi:dihydrofolate reductase
MVTHTKHSASHQSINKINKKMLSLSVAMDKNKLIGKNNTLPWHLPADLKHFRLITMGKPIIMGRKTFDSIGRPLPGRLNVVLTNNQNLLIAGCQVLHRLEEVLALSQQYQESVVIGGATVYDMLLPMVQRMYVTWVHAKMDGDTYFPDYVPEHWQEIERQDFSADANNAYSYSFTVLERHIECEPKISEPETGKQ